MKAELLIFIYEYWFLFLSFIIITTLFIYYFDKNNNKDSNKENDENQKTKNDFILTFELQGFRINYIISAIIVLIFFIFYFLTRE